MCDVHGPLARRPPLFGGSRSRSSRGLLLLITSAGAPCFLNGSNEKVLTQGGGRARRRRSQPASDPPPRGFGRPRGPGGGDTCLCLADLSVAPLCPRRGAFRARALRPHVGAWPGSGIRRRRGAWPLRAHVMADHRTWSYGSPWPWTSPPTKWGGLPHWLNRAPGFPGGGRGCVVQADRVLRQRRPATTSNGRRR